MNIPNLINKSNLIEGCGMKVKWYILGKVVCNMFLIHLIKMLTIRCKKKKKKNKYITQLATKGCLFLELTQLSL